MWARMLSSGNSRQRLWGAKPAKYCILQAFALRGIISGCLECSIAPILPLQAAGHIKFTETSDDVSETSGSVTYTYLREQQKSSKDLGAAAV